MTNSATTDNKPKKPWYMRWWVWLIAAFLIIGGIGAIVDPPKKIEVPDVAGMTAEAAKTHLEDLGFRVSLDREGVAGLTVEDLDATGTDPAAGSTETEGSSVTLLVVEATERIAAQAAAAEEEKAAKEAAERAERERAAAEAATRAAESAAKPLDEDNARPFCLDYAEQSFPYGIKVHYMMGVLAEEKTESGWYMKYEADIKNEYGAKRKSNIECHMSGTNGAPVMDDFLAY